MIKNNVLSAALFCGLLAFSCPGQAKAGALTPAADTSLQTNMQDMLRAPVDTAPKPSAENVRKGYHWVVHFNWTDGFSVEWVKD